MRLRGVFAAAWVVAALGGSVQTARAGGPEAATDLAQAMQTAKTEQKLLFVQLGREACGNCQALRRLIVARDVKLPSKEFVYADINIDDPKQRAVYGAAFKVEGNMLPFVVIADAEGKQLASRSGFGNADDFETLIRDARRLVPKQEKPAQTAVRPAAPAPTSPLLKESLERDLRTWTARNGSTVEARAVREAAPYLHLRKADGASLVVLLSDVSAVDRAYVITQRMTEASASLAR